MLNGSVFRVRFRRLSFATCLAVVALGTASPAIAALDIPFTVTMSEAVNVDTTSGTPRIALTVGNLTRYASYTAGNGTNTLTFTYTPTLGDIDLDGITIATPSIDLNSGTITDLSGNNAALTFTAPDTSAIHVNYPALGANFVADSDGRYSVNGTVHDSFSGFLTAAGATFARATDATYFNSSGTLVTASANTPRFDYHPITHAPKGLLIEEQRSNLLPASADIANVTHWVFNGTNGDTIQSDVVTAPDGTMSADKFAVGTVNNAHARMSINPSVVSGQRYAASIYMKAAGRRYMDMYLGYNSFPTGNGATFDLQTGTISHLFPNTVALIQDVGNGWYRCSVSASAVATGTNNSRLYLWASNNTQLDRPLFAGNGTDGYYVWGAQFEQGAYPSSYIATNNAGATRPRDALTFNGSLYPNGVNGTLQVKGLIENAPVAENTLFLAYNPALNNTTQIIRELSSGTVAIRQRSTTGPTYYNKSTAATYPSGSTINAAVTWNTGNITQGAVNGTAMASDVGAPPSGINTMTPNNGNAFSLNGNLQSLHIYPTNVPQAQLVRLTQ